MANKSFPDVESDILNKLRALEGRNVSTKYANPYHKDMIKTQIEYVRKQLVEFNSALAENENDNEAKIRWLRQVSYLVNQMHITILFSPHFTLSDEEITANKAVVDSLNVKIADIKMAAVQQELAHAVSAQKQEENTAQPQVLPVVPQQKLQVPKSEAVQVIEIAENLLGQDRLASAMHQFLDTAQGYIPDFYKIINDYSHLRAISTTLRDSEKKLALLQLQERIDDFFGKNGMSFEWDVFQSGNFPPDDLLKDNPHLQTLLYFKAYLYTHLCFSDDAKLSLNDSRVIELYNGAASEICDKLKEFSFAPAANLKTTVVTDSEHIEQETIEGAQLGSIACQAKMGRIYLGHLANTLGSDIPEAFNFPPNVNEETILGWLIDARDHGNMDALSYIGNFAVNFFTSVGAMYQNITPEQKERITKMADVLKKISGDDIVNRFVQEVTSIDVANKENAQVISEFKDIRNNATKHVIENFSRPYLEDKDSMQVKLSLINPDKLPHYDQSFAILQIKELNEQITKIKTSLENEKQRLEGRINEKWFGNTDRRERIAAIDKCLNSLANVSRDAQNQVQTKKFNTNTLISSFTSSISTFQSDLAPKSLTSKFKRFINKRVFARAFGDKTEQNIDPIINDVKTALSNIPLLIDPKAEERYKKLVDVIIDRATQGDIMAVKAAMAQPYFDVNMKSSYGDNLLLAAIRSGKADIVRLVLSHNNVDLTENGQRNNNALTCAIEKGDKEIIEAIIAYAIENDVNVADLLNLKDKKGDSPLDAAIIAGNKEAVKMFLEYEGIDVNAPCTGNSTPLTTAILCKQFDILEMLLKHPNIELEKPGFQNKTPMQTALGKNQMGMARLLEQYGAKKIDIDVGMANFAGEAQSSHRDEVHASTAKAIKKLRARYPVVDIDRNLKEIEEFINALPSSDAYLDEFMVAKRSFARMLTLDAKEKITKAEIKEVLALTWHALNDPEHVQDIEAAKRALVKNFALAQREYNMNKDGVDNGKEDNHACNDGTINKIVETLDRIHPDVEIIYDAKGLCGTLAREISQQLFDELDVEQQKRIASILEAHPLNENTLPNDPFFTDLKTAVERGIRKQFGILPEQEDGIIALNDVVTIQNNLRWIEFKLKEPVVESNLSDEEELDKDDVVIAPDMQEPNPMQKQAFNQILKNKNGDVEATIEFLKAKMPHLKLSAGDIAWFRKDKEAEPKVIIEEPNPMQKQAFNQILKNKNGDIEATIEFLKTKMGHLKLNEGNVEWFRKAKAPEPKVLSEEPNPMQKQAFNQIFKNKGEDFDATIDFLKSKMGHLKLSDGNVEWLRKEKSSKRKSLLYNKENVDLTSSKRADKNKDQAQSLQSSAPAKKMDP